MEHFHMTLVSKIDERVVGQAFVYLQPGEQSDFEKIKFGLPFHSPNGDRISVSKPINQVPDKTDNQSIQELNVNVKAETSSYNMCSFSSSQTSLQNSNLMMEETKNLPQEEFSITHLKKDTDNVNNLNSINRNPSGSQPRFLKYFTIVAPRHRHGTVSCNLCDDGSTMSRTEMRRHITKCHMPDKECHHCGQDFSPKFLQAHAAICSQQKKAPFLTVDKFAEDGNGNNAVTDGACVVFNGNLKDEDSKDKTLVFVFEKKKTKTTIGGDRKVKSLFKVLAKRYKTNLDQLQFLHGGTCLTGNELVSNVVGENIIVEMRK